MSAKRKKTGSPAAGKEAKAKKPAAVKPDEMSGEVLEFIQAVDDYKRLHNRPFPNLSEILEILKTLGYERAG